MFIRSDNDNHQQNHWSKLWLEDKQIIILIFIIIMEKLYPYNGKFYTIICGARYEYFGICEIKEHRFSKD